MHMHLTLPRAAWLPGLMVWLACACTGGALEGDMVGGCVHEVEGAGGQWRLRGRGSCAGEDVPITVRVATGDPRAPTWTAADAAPVEMLIAWDHGGRGVEASIRARNAGTGPVELVGVEVTLERASPLGARMLHNGYQSWSYTGVQVVPAQVEERYGTVSRGGDNGNELDEKPGISWWWTWTTDGDGTGITLGATRARIFKSRVGVDRTRMRLVLGATGEALTLAPGEQVNLDGVFVALGKIDEALEAYAAAVALAQAVPARTGRGKLGWGSWNLYYADVTAADLRAEAQWAKEHLVPAGFTEFLLDDGYEPHWGEWTAKPAFGATLDELAAEQVAAGLSPALWTAPTMVGKDAAVVTAHPEYLVQNPSGTPWQERLSNGVDVYHLDMTHPGARAYITDQLQALFAAGYHAFKIDFLFGAATEARRSMPVTSMQHYRLALETIRAAVPEAHLVGCGAPVLPTAGLVDSMRTGPDIGFTVAPAGGFVFNAAQARHTAHRAVTDAWWWLDPDVLINRSTMLTDAEAWSATVATALAGGNYLLGDARQLTPRRLAMALAPQVVELVEDGRTARAEHLDGAEDASIFPSPLLDLQAGTRVPNTWRKRADDGTQWLAVFGWQEAFTLEDARLPSGAVEIVPPATNGEEVTEVPFSGGAVNVPARSVRLFRAR